jgi:uncharacterized membrane protein
MTNGNDGSRPTPSRALGVALWIVQGLVFVLFAGTGVWKLVTPIPKLGAVFPWMGQVSPTFVTMTGVFDLLGGIGILLPTVTRIQPWLAWVAALGCAALQACAIVFHISRGEAANTPFNFVLVAMSLFVAWGRRRGGIKAA